MYKTAGFIALFCTSSLWACVGPDNLAIEARLSKDLAKYKTVTVSVDDCVATLSGQADSMSDKLAALRKARKYGALNAVVNKIAVMVLDVDDQTLTRDVSRALFRDRERNFNLVSFVVSAHNGEVTVSGLAYDTMHRDDALTLVASIRGVREILDQIQVSPIASLYPYLSNQHSVIYGSDCAGTIEQCGNAHW